MILNFLEFENKQNESALWDTIKNKFRGDSNQNVIAEDLFNKIKEDIKNNVEILTSVKKEEDGFIEITLSNKINVKIILVYDDAKNPIEGILILKQPRKDEIKLNIDFSRAKRYINYILSQKEKKIEKAKKAKVAKDIQLMTKSLGRKKNK